MAGVFHTPVWAQKPTPAIDPVLAPQVYFQSLKRAGLQELLLDHCKQILENPLSKTPLRALAVIELSSESNGKGTREIKADQRAKYFGQADQYVNQFLTRYAKSDQTLMVRYRWAGQLIGRGDRLADIALVQKGQEQQETLTEAKGYISEAVKQLPLVQKASELALKERTEDPPPGSDHLSIQELSRLNAASDYRLGRAWTIRTRLADDDTDRNAALVKAEGILQNYTQEIRPLPITMEAFITLGELYWIGKETSKGIALLDRLMKHQIPDNYMVRAAQLKARLHLQANQPAKALELFGRVDVAKKMTPQARLDLIEARLRRGGELWGSQAYDAQRLQQSALKDIDNLEKQFGRYWGIRAENLLGLYGHVESAGDDLELIQRLARVQRSNGQFKRAISTYEKAGQLAKKNGKLDLSTQLSYYAASVAFDQKLYRDAGNRFILLAQDNPKHKLASKSLLSAGYSWARQYAKTRDKNYLEKYHQVLREIVEKYPADDDSAVTAQWFLAELAERSKNWSLATKHYRAIPMRHARFAEAMEALAGIWHDTVIRPTDISFYERTKRANQAIEALQTDLKRLERTDPPTPESKRAISMCQLVLARLYALPNIGKANEAIPLLEKVVTDETLPKSAQAVAWQTLLMQRIELGQADKAKIAAKECFEASPRSLLVPLSRLGPLKPGLSKETRDAEAAVIMESAQKLLANPNILDDRDKFQVRLLMAEAHASQERYEEADTILKRLKLQAPKDLRVALTFAKTSFEVGKYKESMQLWIQLEKYYKKGTADWLLANYYMVACTQHAGFPDRAKKRYNYLKTNWLGNADPSIKKLFEEFAQKNFSS